MSLWFGVFIDNEQRLQRSISKYLAVPERDAEGEGGGRRHRAVCSRGEASILMLTPRAQP